MHISTQRDKEREKRNCLLYRKQRLNRNGAISIPPMKISGVDRCRLVNSIERCPLIVPFNPRRFPTLFPTTPTPILRSSVDRDGDR